MDRRLWGAIFFHFFSFFRPLTYTAFSYCRKEGCRGYFLTSGLSSPPSGAHYPNYHTLHPQERQHYHYRNEHLDAHTSEYYIIVWVVKWPWLSLPNTGKHDALWSTTPSATIVSKLEKFAPPSSTASAVYCHDRSLQPPGHISYSRAILAPTLPPYQRQVGLSLWKVQEIRLLEYCTTS
jgi:hypothetical protein